MEVYRRSTKNLFQNTKKELYKQQLNKIAFILQNNNNNRVIKNLEPIKSVPSNLIILPKIKNFKFKKKPSISKLQLYITNHNVRNLSNERNDSDNLKSSNNNSQNNSLIKNEEDFDTEGILLTRPPLVKENLENSKMKNRIQSYSPFSAMKKIFRKNIKERIQKGKQENKSYIESGDNSIKKSFRNQFFSPNRQINKYLFKNIINTEKNENKIKNVNSIKKNVIKNHYNKCSSCNDILTESNKRKFNLFKSKFNIGNKCKSLENLFQNKLKYYSSLKYISLTFLSKQGLSNLNIINKNSSKELRIQKNILTSSNSRPKNLPLLYVNQNNKCQIKKNSTFNFIRELYNKISDNKNVIKNSSSNNQSIKIENRNLNQNKNLNKNSKKHMNYKGTYEEVRNRRYQRCLYLLEKVKIEKADHLKQINKFFNDSRKYCNLYDDCFKEKNKDKLYDK